MKIIYLGLFYTVITMFLFSCEHFKPNTTTQGTYNPTYDTLELIRNSDGEIGPIKGPTPPKYIKEYTMSEYDFDQVIDFSKGEAIRLIFDGVDLTYKTFDVKYNDNGKAISMRLVNKDTAIIKLTKKCESVQRYNITTIPKIELAEGLNPEQVVVTPLFDDSCSVIGYEIRYGSIESGCSESKSIYKRYKNCKETTNAINQPTKKKCQECKAYEALGLQCPCKKKK